jgi:anti-sigma-K factor RskA
MMDKDKFLRTGLLEQYVLGLTNEEESAEVERYAEAFPELAKEIDEMRKALEQYAMQYVEMPPKELKARVMHSIDQEMTSQHAGNGNGRIPTHQASPWRQRLFNWSLYAAIAVLGAFAFIFQQGKVGAEKNYNQLSVKFEALKSECERNQRDKADVERNYAFFQHPATIPVKLEGSALAPEAEAIAYLNHGQKVACINLTKLPQPPEGKTYQLWADVEGHMINMGVVDFQREDLQIVKYIENAESLNLTLEPAGGSKEPTVELLYANGEV